MSNLNVTDIVFQRGENGCLIPQEIQLNLINKPIIKVVPIPRGKLQEIHALATSSNAAEKVKADNELIKKGLIEPKLTDEQINDLMPKYANAIAIAIMSVSLGVEQKEVEEKADKVIKDQENELKKKLEKKI